MILYLYPEGDGAPDKNIYTSGGPNIPMGYRGDVGLVGAPTPIRLVTLKYLYGPLHPSHLWEAGGGEGVVPKTISLRAHTFGHPS